MYVFLRLQKKTEKIKYGKKARIFTRNLIETKKRLIARRTKGEH